MEGVTLDGMTLPDAPLDASQEVGLKEAARLTGLSLSTLRRRRKELRQFGATQYPDGSWKVPIHALIALGLLDHVTPVETPSVTLPDTSPDTPSDALVNTLRERAEAAERRAVEAEQRAAVAEAVAAERGRALDLAERTLLMLTTAPHPSPEPAPEASPQPAPGSEKPTPPDAERPAVGGWWRRLLG